MFCVQVRLDGAAKRSRHLSKSVAYVPQHDTHLLPYLTVYETCMYSAELQLPWFTSTADKRAKALAVLEELNLLGVANSRVGDAMTKAFEFREICVRAERAGQIWSLSTL